MLRPWSNTVTLAIAEDGVAIHTPNNAVRMLTTENLLNRDYKTVTDALHQHKSMLENQSVRLVLANYLLRFTVLPWQDGVYSRQDWLALADHEFRQQYGAVAHNWQLRVSLGGYGQAVIASAIDQSFFDCLMDTASQLKFKWHAIEPLAMCILNNAKRNNSEWILIAEPQHMLLCETYQGQFQRFSVASPPLGQESTFTVQMITRNQLQRSVQQQPKTTAVYVSGKLSEGWLKQDQDTHKSLNQDIVLPEQQYRYHAEWLATL